ncbi:tRNA uridine-5-carboxymethylaminomethyl(34) synthesis GTPase MnmE [Aquidulcibacter paucihalophilus]|uniref:tRNA uridine-5-carboxymethylaminomethyl(34) synthesis GTPase MnmE n=1 Tax=Aquidulcibacter paucihalophilus TaxID=1978549 RepID=UPI000A18FFA3|nr:tRNA uridine-5-carboxymethylaminomethyl(34) synthesis GTPase MnmE [Aquidulcibacter paucihalophilus]
MTASTIVALASGPGPAGVSIIRLSGPACSNVAEVLIGKVPPARQAKLAKLRDLDGEPIDNALVIFFPGPRSFTGEDVLELHVHGGRAVVRDTIEACLGMAGVRLADAGEFSRRAFIHGKMDLSAAEGLADLVEAETAAQRRQALRQMEGALADEIGRWREAVIDCLADAEGDIDFPDEDLPPGLSERARQRIEDLKRRLETYLAESRRAERVRTGFQIAIVGKPNAGKSSLINQLARREAAIVSAIPGTTRDIVEVRLVIGGMVVLISDTAGIRESSDLIEAEGVRRARQRAVEADLRLGLITDHEDKAEFADLMKAGDLWLLGQADRLDWAAPSAGELAVSSVTRQGLDALEAVIIERAQSDLGKSESAPLTRLRHQEAVREGIDALDRALTASVHAPELVAEDLRLAARALGRITGRVDMEDVLDRLFAQFCIGK